MRLLVIAFAIWFVSPTPTAATGLAPHLGCAGPTFPPGPDYMVSCSRSAMAFSTLLERAQKPCDLIVMVWSSGEIPGHVSLNRVSCLTPTPNDLAPYRTGPSYAVDSLGNIVNIQSEEHWNQIRRTLLGN
jgi:hypothetical protein